MLSKWVLLFALFAGLALAQNRYDEYEYSGDEADPEDAPNSYVTPKPTAPPGTCGHKGCGAYAYHPNAKCQCDAACTTNKDCCPDWKDVCKDSQRSLKDVLADVVRPRSLGRAASCKRKGCHPRTAYARGDACNCDAECVKAGDCCRDYDAQCSALHKYVLPAYVVTGNTRSYEQTCAAKGCDGRGYNSLDDCSCDIYCSVRGDCCSDAGICHSAYLSKKGCPQVRCICPSGQAPEYTNDAAGCTTCKCSYNSGPYIGRAGAGDAGNDVVMASNTATVATGTVQIAAGVAAGLVLVMVVAVLVARRYRRSGRAETATPETTASADLEWDGVGSNADHSSNPSPESLEEPDLKPELSEDFKNMLAKQGIIVEAELRAQEFWSVDSETNLRSVSEA